MRSRLKIAAITAVPPEDIYSINTREELAFVDDVFRKRAAASKTTQAALASSNGAQR